jgi:hypothetical protein
MESIYEANAQFPFDQLSLVTPTLMTGGNYFIKYSMNKKSPLYLQTPKCSTKGGIHIKSPAGSSKTGKRLHCDLAFSNENGEWIQWIEDLEKWTCNALFENRKEWFETDMDLADIESYFTSLFKIYKSGKYYLARTNITPTRLGKITLKIYDENEKDVDPETIQDTTDVITILEFQGIKCSPRNFQMEIELKQMMVLEPVDLFNTCILGKKGEEKTVIEDFAIEAPVVEKASFTATTEETVDNNNDNRVDIEKTAAVDPALEDLEVKIDIDEIDDEKVQIRDRKEVYIEMYKQAKQRAREARNAALVAYLEAKQIKETYLLDSVEDLDDDDEEGVDR